jgi:UPF0716 protein FxsA
MAMFALILVVLPIAEVASIVWVAHQVGVLATLGLLVGVSVVGAVLAKHVGLEVWRRFRATLAAGDIPTGEVFDGVLVLIAAVLLVIPGFITDILGLLLLIPAVRSLVKWMAWRRMRRRLIELTERTGNRLGARRATPVRVESVRLVDRPDAGPAGAGGPPVPRD